MVHWTLGPFNATTNLVLSANLVIAHVPSFGSSAIWIQGTWSTWDPALWDLVEPGIICASAIQAARDPFGLEDHLRPDFLAPRDQLGLAHLGPTEGSFGTWPFGTQEHLGLGQLGPGAITFVWCADRFKTTLSLHMLCDYSTTIHYNTIRVVLPCTGYVVRV